MWYDTHAHLASTEFASDLPQVIERALAAGVSRIITLGTDLESSRRSVELSREYPCVYAAVGWHPSDAASAPEDVRPVLRRLAEDSKVVAIGEIGLDYYRLPSKRRGGTAADDEVYIARQKQIFQQQLELAAELGLNCVVHQRDSFEDTLEAVRKFQGRVRTVFHCFSGPAADLDRVLAIGSMVSFTGIVTFQNAQTVRDSVAAAPLGQFMLETDCPYLAPMPYRGKRCEPAYVQETAAVVHEVKSISAAELSTATCAAADDFFRRLRA
jgi:TatD DNase family protein